MSVREDLDKAQQKWQEDSMKYEDAHLGNFRRIYPAENTEKYDKFFQTSGSLYQETAACKARSECARFVTGQLAENMRSKCRTMMLKTDWPADGEIVYSCRTHLHAPRRLFKFNLTSQLRQFTGNNGRRFSADKKSWTPF